MFVKSGPSVGSSFYGRAKLLDRLRRQLDQVAREGRGQLLAVRGRRQMGKSRLFTEVVEGSDWPYLFFTAVKEASPVGQLGQLTNDVFESVRPLPDADSLFASPPTDWSDALGRIALACSRVPTVVVFDEFPWAAASDPTLEGRLQNAWDKQLEGSPVLFVLIGSDVSTMERLTEYDRPLYGRTRSLVVRPFDPAECAEVAGGSAASAFETRLVTGGYPRLVLACARTPGPQDFVADQLTDENNDLVVIGQRSIDAEFPEGEQVRRVLHAIGGWEVGAATFSEIVGRLPEESAAAQTATSRSVKILSEDKGVVSIDRPVGAAKKSKLRRYRIDDTYLRFWFRFVASQVANIARGRSDIALKRFERDWSTWRGMAIEPLVRDAVLRLAPDFEALTDVEQVGAWWNRTNTHEFDLVAADAGGATPAAIGSVKWRERSKFTGPELTDLQTGRTVIPGAADARLLVVCPAGVAPGVRPDLVLTPADLLAAYERQV